MKSILLVLALVPLALAQVPGKAYPVEVDAATELLFQGINPLINWDIQNFLVDMSGPYTLCSKVGQKGFFDVDEKTRDGATIGGLVDDTESSGNTADVVEEDILRVMRTWTKTSPFKDQIAKAKKFGCSVAPGCRGRTVMACLFSPSYISYQRGRPISEITAPPKPPHRNTGRRRLGLGKALAFTENQIAQVESITGVSWDRTNYLEDSSGFETDCKMITARDWHWKEAKAEAKERDMKVKGMYGSVPFSHSTTDSISMILIGWQKHHHHHIRNVGCSCIPDCMSVDGSTETVVISCLFSHD